MKLIEKTINFWLRFSAIYMPFLRTPKVFSGEVTFECNFKNAEELKQKFHVTNNEFYNHLPVLFTDKMLTLFGGLHIYCRKRNGTLTTWQRTGEYEWETGWKPYSLAHGRHCGCCIAIILYPKSTKIISFQKLTLPNAITAKLITCFISVMTLKSIQRMEGLTAFANLMENCTNMLLKFSRTVTIIIWMGIW